MDTRIPRSSEKQIHQELKTKEYLALIGPRQAGKTTLLQHIHRTLLDSDEITHDQIVSITFEDPLERITFQDDPLHYIRGHLHPHKPTYILIDEYQYTENAGHLLKLVYDTFPELKIIFTGSSALDIRNIGAAMVGRLITIELFPLSFQEIVGGTLDNYTATTARDYHHAIRSFLTDHKLPDLPPLPAKIQQTLATQFQDYILYGGYPAVVLEPSLQRKERLLMNIYNTYVEKDIVTLLKNSETEKFFRFIKYLALTIGQLTPQSNIQQELRLRYADVDLHLSMVQQTFLLQRIAPYYTNKLNELKKTPLYYFHDTGLRNWAIRSFNSLDNRTDAGHLIENATFNAMRALLHDDHTFSGIYFWRKSTGTEVDCVLEQGGETPGVIPIEVKYQIFSKPELTRSYHSFLQEYLPKRGLVVTRDFLAHQKVGETDVLFVPAYLL